jgi:hypothetical protein
MGGTLACEARLGPCDDDGLFMMGWEEALTVHEKTLTKKY